MPDPHRPGARSLEHRAIAVALNELTKLVFSRTLNEVTWRNARLVRDLDPRAIEAMKRQPGKDMMIFGSGSIVSQLTQAGLIDEYQGVPPESLEALVRPAPEEHGVDARDGGRGRPALFLVRHHPVQIAVGPGEEP